ncbi:MAG: hypothetical protein H9Q66_04685 [Spiroplasma ixodetis]|nr:hypothetical protein [Spiroplasma ixodetis]
MANEERLYEFEEALRDIKWDIIGLAEVRRKGEGLIRRKNGNYLYYFGETKGYKGIGFYINHRIWNKVIEIKRSTERIGIIKIEIEKKTVLTIIVVYAPTAEKGEDEIEEFYENLERTKQECQEYFTILLGDWNAKIGKGEAKGVVGPHGLGKRNERGDRLIEFAQSNVLTIAGTYFKKRESKRWTWESPNGETRNEIDHLLTSDISIVKNINVLSNFKFASDHRIVRGTIKIPKRIRIKNFINNNNRGKKRIPPSKHELAKEYLERQLSTLKIVNQETQETYNKFESILLNTINKFGIKEGEIKTDDKLTRKTKDLIEKREGLRKINRKSRKERIELSELQKLTRREIKKDLRDYEETKIKEIIEERGSTKKIWKELSTGRNIMMELKDRNGGMRSNRRELLQIATEFHKETYRCKEEEKTTDTTVRDEEEEIPIILKAEVEETLKNAKMNKSPGPDTIENNFLRLFKDSILNPLTDIFNLILINQDIPEQWKISEIILLYKKGNRKDIRNYRPISLSSNISKMFMKIIKNRIYNQLDTNQTPEQAGFRKNYSTIDHLQTMNQIIEKALEYQIEIHILFIDFQKAFDTIKHQYLWKCLRKQGIPTKIIKLLKNTYENSRAYVRIEQKGETFKIERGVKQGDPLSPNLFNAIIENMIRELEWEGRGIKMDGRYLSNLRFADDLILLSTSKEELMQMKEDLEEKSREGGLEINYNKTKYMKYNGSGALIEQTGDGTDIEEVKEYNYLGQVVAFEDRTEKELKNRKSKAWRKFWALKKILENRRVKLNLKVNTLESCVLPVLSYGAQTWSLTKSQSEKIQKTQRAMERRILGLRIKDRVSNRRMRSETQSKDIGYTIKKLKFKYAGHMYRTQEDRWNRRATDWTPYGNIRAKGRPKTRWRDEIRNRVGKSWKDTARDRFRWRRIGEAYAREWADYI